MTEATMEWSTKRNEQLKGIELITVEGTEEFCRQTVSKTFKYRDSGIAHRFDILFPFYDSKPVATFSTGTEALCEETKNTIITKIIQCCSGEGDG
jgi:hypothetical protein